MNAAERASVSDASKRTPVSAPRGSGRNRKTYNGRGSASSGGKQKKVAWLPRYPDDVETMDSRAQTMTNENSRPRSRRSRNEKKIEKFPTFLIRRAAGDVYIYTDAVYIQTVSEIATFLCTHREVYVKKRKWRFRSHARGGSVGCLAICSRLSASRTVADGRRREISDVREPRPLHDTKCSSAKRSLYIYTTVGRKNTN